MGTKKNLTILLLVFLPLSLQAQIRPDFLLADSAAAPSVAYDTTGKLYIAWKSTRDTQIVYNTFDENFNPTQSIVKMSRTYTYDPFAPVVTVGNNGGLISWNELFPDFGARYVYGQLLNAEGDTNGTSFRIDNPDYSVADRRVPDATYLTDTTFVVMWSGNGPATGDLPGLYGRLGSNPSGMSGLNLHLSDDRPPVSSLGRVKVTAKPLSGDFMAVWSERETQAAKPFLLGRIFDQNGSPKDSSEILTADTLYDDLWSTAIQCNSNGEYIVAWSERRDTSWYIKLKMLDENGSPLGMVGTVNPEGKAEPYASLDVAVDINGDFLVVWEQPENGKSKIFGQRYSSDGNAIGANFKISFSPDTADHYFPSLVLYEKKIYVVWNATWIVSQEIMVQVWGKILDFDNPVSSVEHRPASVPQGFVLLNSYPNPFNPLTNIEYRIELPLANVRLDIYDLKGQLIKRLVEKKQTAGLYRISWDATDNIGKILPSGIYFASLAVNGKRQVKKLVLLR